MLFKLVCATNDHIRTLNCCSLHFFCKGTMFKNWFDGNSSFGFYSHEVSSNALESFHAVTKFPSASNQLASHHFVISEELPYFQSGAC